MTVGDFCAGGALVAGRVAEALLAVERLGENARSRGLADTARTGEQKSVVHPIGADGIAESATDVLLPDEVGERLRSPFAGQYQIRHALQATPGKNERTPADPKSIAGTSDSQAPPRHTEPVVTAAPFRA